jgi:hypothetical protein
MSFYIILDLVVYEYRRGVFVRVRTGASSSMAAVDGIASMKARAVLSFRLIGSAKVEIVAGARSGECRDDEDCRSGPRERARGYGG